MNAPLLQDGLPLPATTRVVTRHHGSMVPGSMLGFIVPSRLEGGELSPPSITPPLVNPEEAPHSLIARPCDLAGGSTRYSWAGNIPRFIQCKSA